MGRKTAYQIKISNKRTGEQYLLTFHDERDRDDARALMEEAGPSAFMNGYGGFAEETS